MTFVLDAEAYLIVLPQFPGLCCPWQGSIILSWIIFKAVLFIPMNCKVLFAVHFKYSCLLLFSFLQLADYGSQSFLKLLKAFISGTVEKFTVNSSSFLLCHQEFRQRQPICYLVQFLLSHSTSEFFKSCNSFSL